MDASRRLIGEYLVADNKIKPEQLQKALERQANSIQGGHMPLLGTILVEMGLVSERDLNEALERQQQDRREFNPAMFPPDLNSRKS